MCIFASQFLISHDKVSESKVTLSTIGRKQGFLNIQRLKKSWINEERAKLLIVMNSDIHVTTIETAQKTQAFQAQSVSWVLQGCRSCGKAEPFEDD